MIEKKESQIDHDAGDTTSASRHSWTGLGFRALNASSSFNARFCKLASSDAANMRRLCELQAIRRKLDRDHRFANSDQSCRNVSAGWQAGAGLQALFFRPCLSGFLRPGQARRFDWFTRYALLRLLPIKIGQALRL
jgi:hypothetical protein